MSAGRLPFRAIIILVLVLNSFIESVVSAKFLIIHPVYSGSHFITLRNYGEYLVGNGHSVTLVKAKETNSKAMRESTKVEVIEVALRDDDQACTSIVNGLGEVDLRIKMFKTFWECGDSPIRMLDPEVYSTMKLYCKTLLEDAELFSLLRSSRFDVAVVDMFANDCGLALVHAIGIPAVASFWGFSFQGGPVTFTSTFNPPSIVPSFYSGSSSQMGFAERCTNFVLFLGQRMLTEMQTAMTQSYLSSRFPGLLPLKKMWHEVDLHLLNTNFLIDSARLVAPNVKYIGGIQLREGKKLPEDLSEFVNNGTHRGVVVLSFGYTGFEAKVVPQHILEAFMGAFSRLKNLRVIMRFHREFLPGKPPENVLVREWVPQQDLLASPKVVAFITHCGLFGLQEAFYHRVPVIGFPVFNDQVDNARRVEEKGLGLVIWKRWNVSANEVYRKIVEVVGDKKYLGRVSRLADLWRERPFSPAEEMRHWLEFLAKHGNNGTQHLKIPDGDFSIVCYFSIDVIAVCLVTLAFVLRAVAVAVRSIYWKCKLMAIDSDAK